MYKFASFPKANKSNIITWGNYRVTVLADRLFRVEKSETLNKKGQLVFNDKATQGVLFRNMPKNDFTYNEGVDTLEIRTPATTFVLNKDVNKSYVVIEGKNKLIYNNGNLKATNRTLDGYEGDTCIFPDRLGEKLELTDGVCSRTGVAVLDDTASIILEEQGKFSHSPCSLDIYVFAYGTDYVGAVKAFYMIEGSIPAVPRYAFGNWWSRYFDYTDKTYLAVLNKFKEEQVPLSVATIDMDWHYSDNVDKQKKITESGRYHEDYIGRLWGGLGWTGYSWNKEFFPDPKAFLSKVKEQNLAITLNLHPADGVRYWEDCYPTFAKNMGVTGDKQIKFDLVDEKYATNYFKLLHHPQEDIGVDFWWIDWQQWTTTSVEGLDPLWLLNHYHYLDNQERHGKGLILSRFCGAGSHRYPLGFSGDATISWATLDYLPKFTATSSNIGYTLWSHDIGGHCLGERDEELYVRSLQYGVFSPITRLHSAKQMAVAKEPWLYTNGGGEIVKNFMRFRHQLVPYIYSEVTNNSVYNIPWIQPLYYHYPKLEEAYEYTNQYFFGSQLMVAPITKKSTDELKGWGSVDAYIPKGVWTDIFTGERYSQGKITMHRPLQSIPVLIKEGGVLPLAKVSSDNGCFIPEELIVKSYKGDGEFKFYECADATIGISFTNKYENGVQTLTIKGFGDPLVTNRQVRVEFSNISEGEIEYYENGSKKKFNEYYGDCVGLVIDNFKNGKEYKIVVTVKQQSPLEFLQKSAITFLAQVDGNNPTKYGIVDSINACTTVKELVTLIKENKDLDNMPPFKTKMDEVLQYFSVKE